MAENFEKMISRYKSSFLWGMLAGGVGGYVVMISGGIQISAGGWLLITVAMGGFGILRMYLDCQKAMKQACAKEGEPDGTQVSRWMKWSVESEFRAVTIGYGTAITMVCWGAMGISGAIELSLCILGISIAKHFFAKRIQRLVSQAHPS